MPDSMSSKQMTGCDFPTSCSPHSSTNECFDPLIAFEAEEEAEEEDSEGLADVLPKGSKKDSNFGRFFSAM